MILRQLRSEDQAAFEKLIVAWGDSDGFGMLYELVEGMSFETYLKVLQEMRDGIGLSGKQVPATALFAFEGNEIVGKANVRHALNDSLEKVGGHIGYGVVEEHRQKGYASEILKQALEYCRGLGLKRVLVTCNDDNVASWKVIEKNGGVLENYYDPKDGTSKKRRYWIDLHS